MPHDIARDLGLLQEADSRLVRTVDGFQGDDWVHPSGLPDWSRAHVVAHLALNAEALAGALHGIVEGEPAAMYASQEARDGDIADLAQGEASELRERLMGGCGLFTEAATAMTDEAWSAEIERVPGGPTFRAASVPLMRLREVEIHHADLDAGYGIGDWPASFSHRLLHEIATGYATRADAPALTLHPDET
ncbi:MAG: maleylpyruvate isomerase N-terminal domain-containing protein, partial [Nocardioides sp.]